MRKEELLFAPLSSGKFDFDIDHLHYKDIDLKEAITLIQTKTTWTKKEICSELAKYVLKDKDPSGARRLLQLIDTQWEDKHEKA